MTACRIAGSAATDWRRSGGPPGAIPTSTAFATAASTGSDSIRAGPTPTATACAIGPRSGGGRRIRDAPTPTGTASRTGWRCEPAQIRASAKAIPPEGVARAPPAPRAPAAPRGFPSPSTTGVPAGWTPAQVRTTSLEVTQPGAVVQDVLLQNASLRVDAPNVTIRRVKLQGGWISNQPGSLCRGNGLTIEDTTIEPPPGQSATKESEGVVSYGGYTARRVKIWRRSEGFRVSSKEAGCGPVRIEDSFVKIVDSGDCALHADGIQGYGGNALTVVNTTVDGSDIKCGTAPFFYPRNQGNTRADVNGLLVMGAGYSFRDGMPGSVRGLKIVNGSWIFGPISVRCSALSSWQADIVDINAGYQPTATVRQLGCTTNEGG